MIMTAGEQAVTQSVLIVCSLSFEMDTNQLKMTGFVCTQVVPDKIKQYLRDRKAEGYTIAGLEQVRARGNE